MTLCITLSLNILVRMFPKLMKYPIKDHHETLCTFLPNYTTAFVCDLDHNFVLLHGRQYEIIEETKSNTS